LIAGRRKQNRARQREVDERRRRHGSPGKALAVAEDGITARLERTNEQSWTGSSGRLEQIEPNN
jgi:hypothetical protein